MTTNLFQPAPLPVVGYARVALERGIDVSRDGLTYAVPESLADLGVGQRVVVPLGRGDKPVMGIVTAVDRLGEGEGEKRGEGGSSGLAAGSRIKPIQSLDPLGLSLTGDLVELGRWMAGYYCCPLGMVLATMIPAAVKRGTGRTLKTLVSWVARPGEAEGDDASSAPSPVGDSPKLSKLQRAIVGVARERFDRGQPWVEIKELADLGGARTIGPVKALIEKGWLTTQQEQTVSSRIELIDPVGGRGDSGRGSGGQGEAVALTDDQATALRELTARLDSGFGVYLLHGVTGSGKTEIYLRVIERVLSGGLAGGAGSDQTGSAGDDQREGSIGGQGGGGDPETLGEGGLGAGKGAIVLVPEIALTPQTVDRFSRRFDAVAVLHSGLTGAQRHEQWRRIRSGEARVVIGARSAVFAPLPDLGVIIVDEEHDSSYKQDQLPRYHGRDVAVKRGQTLGVPVVLGSATPSLESYYNATVKKSYHLLTLPRRVAGLKLPRVRVVDMFEERRRRRGVHLLSAGLEEALRRTLDEGGQAMLLLNRRGWAHYIACPDPLCGWQMNCRDCDAMMVYHKDHQLPAGGLVRCHHCRAEQLLPSRCAVCEKRVTVFGGGTQRLEDEVEQKFPSARMLRMDSDTMRNARDYHETLEAFGKGDVDLLVGTQIIAKGLDFPNVRLVGVISADQSLHVPDFRASERTFQLIAQVAGRAGRGEHPGLVVVQTYQPNDQAIDLACGHDYEGFARRELEVRRQAGLPPWARMARVVVRDRDPVRVEEHARSLGCHLKQENARVGDPVQILGPAPCPIARIAGYHRRQVELIAAGPGGAVVIQRLLGALRGARLLVSDARTAVDVDPVVLM